MSFDRLRYELLLMGRRVILTPVLVMVCFGLFAGLLAYLVAVGRNRVWQRQQHHV